MTWTGRIWRAWVVFLALAAILIGVLRWETLSVWPGRDAGTFAYIGWELAEHGGVLYRDFWDHKPPLIHYLNATLFRAFGPSTQVMAAFEMVWLLGIAVAVFWLGRRLFSAWTGWWLALLFLAYGGGIRLIENFGMTETYALLPALLAMAALWQYTRNQKFAWAFLAGVFVVTAGLFRPVAIGVGFPVLLGLVTLSRAQGMSWGVVLRTVAVYLSGGTIMLLVAILPFVLTGTAADLWSQVIVYNQQYSSGGDRTWGEILRLLLPALRSSGLGKHPLLLTLAGIGVIGATFVRKPRRESWAFLGVLVSWAVVEFLSLSLGGRYYEHYFYQLLGPLVLLAGYVLQAVGSSKFQNVVLAGVWVGTIWLVSPLATEIAETAGLDPQRVQAATWVQDNTLPGDRIYFWGAEAELNFVTQRRSLSPYSYIYPLEVSTYVTAAMREEFLRSLERERPPYIIDTSGTNSVVVSLADGLMRVSDDIFSADVMAPIVAHIQRHYAASERVGEWVVYRRKD